MKTPKLLIFLFSLLILRSFADAQWEKLNEGCEGEIRSFDFINADLGWISGAFRDVKKLILLR